MMALIRKSSVLAGYHHVADLEGRDAISTETCNSNPATNSISEKFLPKWSDSDVEQSSQYYIGSGGRLKWLRSNLKLQLLGFLCVAGLFLLVQKFDTCESPLETTISVLSDRGSDAQAAVAGAAKVSMKPSSTGVLEVFQVYQPVLTPSGPTDEIISSDGSSNTTAIISTENGSSCTQLLMEYSFGFSYGHPFVGTLCK
jgi:hypothetical protein